MCSSFIMKKLLLISLIGTFGLLVATSALTAEDELGSHFGKIPVLDPKGEVYKTEGADSGGGQIECEWRTKPTGTNTKYLGVA